MTSEYKICSELDGSIFTYVIIFTNSLNREDSRVFFSLNAFKNFKEYLDSNGMPFKVFRNTKKVNDLLRETEDDRNTTFYQKGLFGGGRSGRRSRFRRSMRR